ncbi:MAG: tetratricopeptide repeat protein [Calditrichaeota bacterium]|nr:MAG: tetratricopeptide repeat protein [Calditrichota bacterium]
MRKTIWIFLFALIPLWAQTADNLFEQANQAYRDGKFEQALSLYKQIEEQGMVSGALYFNMGNAAYRLRKYGLARLYYERAKKLMPNDEDLKYNMELLTLRLTDQIKDPPQLFLFRWWHGLTELLPAKGWGMASLTLLIVTLTGWAFFFYRRNRGRSVQLRVASYLSFLWVFVMIIWVTKSYREQTDRYAVVLVPSETVHAEPSETTTELFILHEGAKVKIEQQNNNWALIRLKDGKTGWLSSKSIEEI